MAGPTAMDIEGILARIPHRFPTLMLDRVLEAEPGRIRACKCVSANDIVFLGHFPGRPILPGVMIVEAMAQAAGVMLCGEAPAPAAEEKDFLLVKIDNLRFLRPVRPGEVLVVEVRLLKRAGDLALVNGEATVDGEKVASGVLGLGLRDRPREDPA